MIAGPGPRQSPQAVANVALADPRNGSVHGDDQRAETCARDAVQKRFGSAAILQNVKLKSIFRRHAIQQLFGRCHTER